MLHVYTNTYDRNKLHLIDLNVYRFVSSLILEEISDFTTILQVNRDKFNTNPDVPW
jgi:hypothetical protein